MKLKIQFLYGLQLFPAATVLLVAANVSADERPPNFLENVPPWETYEAPPQVIQDDPPVYLNTDSKGNVFRKSIVRDENGQYEIREESLSESEVDQLIQERNVILRDQEAVDLATNMAMSGPMAQSSSTTTCPLPSSFTLVSNSSGVPQNNEMHLDTSRPADATTQWVVFDYYTVDYRGAGSHLPIVAFFENDLHGWGAFIGDNHEHTKGWYCDSNALFNSQIEGFMTIDDDSSPGLSNQNYSFHGTDSCGNEMYDGAVVIIPTISHVPRYRFEMQASTGHWVAYRIFEWKRSLNDWEVLTDWKVIDVDTANWEFPPEAPATEVPWLSDSEGIFIGPTKSVPAVTDAWSINISNVTCGWF